MGEKIALLNSPQFILSYFYDMPKASHKWLPAVVSFISRKQFNWIA